MTNSRHSNREAKHLLLAVRVAEKLHALPIALVEEVLPNLPIEPVPQCPAFIRGVIFVRGHLIPLLDARDRLGLPEQGRCLDPQIVCLHVGGRLVGVVVDEAIDLIEAAPAEFLPAEDVGARQGFFKGLFERDGQVIRLLDPEQLFAADEAHALDKVFHQSAVAGASNVAM